MLDLEFMRLAFAVGVVVGVLAPAVGFFLVERRQSLVGDGLGHVAFAGVAAGLPARHLARADRPLLRRGRARSRSSGSARAAATAGDQALALVFYTGIALGIVLVSSANRLDVGLFQFLFGSILTVTRDRPLGRARARQRLARRDRGPLPGARRESCSTRREAASRASVSRRSTPSSPCSPRSPSGSRCGSSGSS